MCVCFVWVFCCCFLLLFFGGLCRFVSYEAIGPSQYAEYHLALGFRIGLLPCLKMSVFFQIGSVYFQEIRFAESLPSKVFCKSSGSA